MTSEFSHALPLKRDIAEACLPRIQSQVLGDEKRHSVSPMALPGEAHDDLDMGIRFVKGVLLGILLSSPIWAIIFWFLL